MYKSLIAATVLGAFTLPAQDAGLSKEAEEKLEYQIEMPAEPAWQNYTNGNSIARMRMQVAGAAACQMSFGYLGLAAGEEMYIRSAGSAFGPATHGPYLERGPINFPNFDSLWLPGNEFVIEVIGKKSASWPFIASAIRCKTDEELTAAFGPNVRLKKQYRPSVFKKSALRKTGVFEGEFVQLADDNGVGVLQGDIVVEDPNDAEVMKKGPRGSAVLTMDSRRWPGFRVPYEIDFSMTDDIELSRVMSGVNYWNSMFPGLLVPRTNETDYVQFIASAKYCRSALGRKGGRQYIELAPGCNNGAVNHEIGHAVGLYHEMSRTDRDQYIKINFDNIEPDQVYNFDMLKTTEGKNSGTYDYTSLMHYHRYAFSVNDKPTIEPLKPLPAGYTLGSNQGLSQGDINGAKEIICREWFIAPVGPAVEGEGGTFTVSFFLPPYCSWTASDNVTWMSLSKTSGTGSGSFVVTVLPNANIKANRVGTITINGQPMTVKQYPLGY